MEVLQGDVDQALTALELGLQTKCDYWMRLPHMMCALALADEEQARICGQRVLEAFDADPRQAAHHRRTWKLLQPDSAFRAGLIEFV